MSEFLRKVVIGVFTFSFKMSKLNVTRRQEIFLKFLSVCSSVCRLNCHVHCLHVFTNTCKTICRLYCDNTDVSLIYVYRWRVALSTSHVTSERRLTINKRALKTYNLYYFSFDSLLNQTYFKEIIVCKTDVGAYMLCPKKCSGFCP